MAPLLHRAAIMRSTGVNRVWLSGSKRYSLADVQHWPLVGCQESTSVIEALRKKLS